MRAFVRAYTCMSMCGGAYNDYDIPGSKCLVGFSKCGFPGFVPSACIIAFVCPPQGRVLYETLVYKEVPGHPDQWLVECCSKVQSDLVKHLRRYILRAQVCGGGEGPGGRGCGRGVCVNGGVR